MQAVQPAGEGADCFFDTLRNWTEAPAAGGSGEAEAGPDAPARRRLLCRMNAGAAASHSPDGERSSGRSEGSFAAAGLSTIARGFPAAQERSRAARQQKTLFGASLRADEKETFTQGKEAAIARLGRLRQALERLEEDFKEIKKRTVARARELATEISAQNQFLTS